MIRVSARAGAYDVHCYAGALDDLGALMRAAGLRGAAFIISDANVGALLRERAMASLSSAGFSPRTYMFPAGEQSKSLDTVRAVYDWLVEARAERGSPIVALGGGVVGDLAGFVAATYLRGVPFVQAPTSLLAMVDAAIGGKVAVDHPRGKNLIGAFYPPALVVEDPALLSSLPGRCLREGFAEVIKHALIMDPPMLDVLEGDTDALLGGDVLALADIVARNAALKAGVVSEDEREGGRRMILNYGHTVGHAIEAVRGYTGILHGEAISMGMMAAATIGRALRVTPPAVVGRQAALLERYGLPTRGKGMDIDAVIAATAHDKKVDAGQVRWVLLEDAGRPIVRDDVPADVVRQAVAGVLS